MSNEQKKDKTNEKRKALSDNTRITIRVIAVAMVIVAVFLVTPFGRNLFKGKPDNTTTAAPESTEAISTTVEKTTREKSKYFNLLVNTADFTYVTKDGVMTIKTKDNDKLYMTITPFTDKSFDDCCNELKNTYAEVDLKKPFSNIKNETKSYRIQSGDKDTDTITTVYCVDNGEKGAIEIKYITTVAADKTYSAKFEKMLSFFYLIEN